MYITGFVSSRIAVQTAWQMAPRERLRAVSYCLLLSHRRPVTERSAAQCSAAEVHAWATWAVRSHHTKFTPGFFPPHTHHHIYFRYSFCKSKSWHALWDVIISIVVTVVTAVAPNQNLTINGFKEKKKKSAIKKSVKMRMINIKELL